MRWTYPFLRRRRGSVLVIVMITLLFAVFALVTFMEKASVDLLVDQREALTKRLRMEAYSALEVTLGVLADFQEVGNGLRSPAEGWSDPLGFASYTPSDGRTVEVAFEDESAKISLPHANAQVLTNLFFNWGIQRAEAEGMSDALLGWMKRGHVYTSTVEPNYETGAIPYEVPGRPMRSFEELAAIEKVRDLFYDREGRPNDLWRRFGESVSLFDFRQSNINGARPDTLAALGQFDETQRKNLDEFFRGEGSYQSMGPGFFQSAAEAQRIAGPTGNTAAFGATISALRITVIVREGRSEFRMATVIAPPNGAQTVQATATSTKTQASATPGQTAAQQQNRPNATQANVRPGAASTTNQQNAATARNLKYPFTLLEIRENVEITGSSSARPTT